MAICIDQIYKEKSCIALKNTHIREYLSQMHIQFGYSYQFKVSVL